MRRLIWIFCSLLVAASAFALDNPPPDAARRAAVVYLDGLARARLADRVREVSALNSAADVERRQQAVRQKILALIGGLPQRPSPPQVRITGRHDEDGFRIENVVFESLPGYRVTANVYIPAGTGPFPAVVISPGHSPAGKASDYAFAANFARSGILAFSYDIVGEGERWQNYNPASGRSDLERPTGEHSLMAYQTLLMGEPVTRYFLNDAMAGIDYLATRKDVDASRIGAYGCSGGGTITAMLAAMDPRVKVAASACFVTTMNHLLDTVGPQDGEQSIPGFTAAGLDLPDWVELAAPKPYAIVSTTEDMFPFAGAREAHAEALRIWDLFGAADKLHWITGPGPHGALAPVSADIVAFFTEYLKEQKSKTDFAVLRPAHAGDVLATASGQLSSSIGSETLQSLMAALAKRVGAKPAIVRTQAERTARTAILRRDIRAVTRAAVQPGKTLPKVLTVETAVEDGLDIARLAFRPANGPEFAGLQAMPQGKSRGRIILLTDDVSAAAPDGRIRALAARGWQVLAIASAGGHGEEIKAKLLGDYALFALRAMLVGRTVSGLRIDQVLEAADWLTQQKGAGPLLVFGVGGSGPAVLQAAMLDDRIEGVIVEGAQASYRLSVDKPLSRNLPEIALPGVLRRYDLPDLAAALAPRPVWFVAPTDQMGAPLPETEFRRSMTSASDASAGRIHLVPVFSPDILADKD